MGDYLRATGDSTRGAATAPPWLFTAAVRFFVLAARIAALASLVFGLVAALGLLTTKSLGIADFGSLPGSLIYFVSTLLLAWGICQARPVSVGPAAKHAAAATFMFIVLLVAIAFVNLIAVGALVSKPFDFGDVIYGIVTLLLAGGIARARSAASFSVMVLLAAVAFITVTYGAFTSGYEGIPRSDGPAGASLAELVVDLRKEHKLVGLAAMVMVDGKVIASAAHGERKRGSGVPIELGDRWHLGSITKSITATMIARLVESGQMKWTETIGERFPDASIHNDWKPVTLEQLLNHTSGAPANFSLGVRLKKPALGPECTRERRKAVIEVMADRPAQRPGEKFAYSNVGYTIAGAMAEAATGVSWEDLVAREVFEPLALHGAGFGPPKSPSETLDQPRGHRGIGDWKTTASDEQDNTPIIGPAGTVHMTLSDLCKYATEHLRGELGAGTLLTLDTCQRLHKPALDHYAYGWVVKQPTDEIPHTVYWHNGSNTMWYALVAFIPGKNMVFTVTTNDGDIRAAESAAWKIVKAGAHQFDVADDAAHRNSGAAKTTEK
jgi:CubicO group peptidase (beta-lactamase class C family)